MDLLAHILHYFVVVLTSFFIVLHCLYILFHLLYLLPHLFPYLKWWSFTFQCMDEGHVPFHSYLMDIGLKILSWKCHFFRESLSTSLFESISISLCILNGVHLLIFRVCTGKKKWMKKKGNKRMYIVSSSIECIYWSLRLVSLS